MPERVPFTDVSDRTPLTTVAAFDLQFLDSVPTAIFIHDTWGRPYFANQQARSLFGVSTDPTITPDLVAAAAEIYVADTDTRYPLDQLSTATTYNTGQSRFDKMEIRRVGGTVHLEVWVKPTFADDGSVAWIVHSFVDSSDRKNMDADLVLNESLTKAVATAPGFADVLETSLHEICQLTGWSFGQAWLPDSEGASLRCKFAWHEESVGFREFHKACRAMVLPPGGGLAGRAWLSRQWEWSDEDGLLVSAEVDDRSSVFLAGHRERVAMPVLVDDEVVAVLEFLVLVGGSQDQRSVDRVASVVSRVGLWMSTKGAEDAGRRSEEKFRQIAEATTDAIIFASADTRILYLNPAAELLFGYTADEVSGQLMSELLYDRPNSSGDNSSPPALHLRKDTLTGPPLMLTAQRKDGVEFPIEITLARWQEGEETFLTAIIRDSSDRVHTERKLRETLGLERKAHEQLQALDALKYTVLQTVAHDLRSPIAAVLILTGILRADAEQPAPQVRVSLLSDIERSMRKMGRLLQDLLDSDPAQPIRARRRRSDVAELVTRVLAESDISSSHPVHCELEPVTINVDAAQVERMVENLLNNAVKYVADGVPVWVTTTAREGGVLIAVDDAGAGVPPHLRESIFEPFRRGEDPQSLSLGLGLGSVAGRPLCRAERGSRMGRGASRRRRVLPDLPP